MRYDIILILEVIFMRIFDRPCMHLCTSPLNVMCRTLFNESGKMLARHLAAQAHQSTLDCIQYLITLYFKHVSLKTIEHHTRDSLSTHK